MKRTDILPCPYCGPDGSVDTFGRPSRTECLTCGASAPQRATWEESRATWNSMVKGIVAGRMLGECASDALLHGQLQDAGLEEGAA